MRTKEAVALFGGSKTKLAQALGITRQAVSNWGEVVPETRQWQIELFLRRRDDLAANPAK